MSLDYNTKTYRIFNKFFSSFLKQLKEVNEDLRKKVKASYKVVDKTQDEYCKFFASNMVPVLTNIVEENFTDDVRDKQMCKDITVGDVMDTPDDIKGYVYVLMLFAYMSTLEDENDLLVQVMRILGYIETGDDTSYTEEVDDLIDDDIKAIIVKIKQYGVKSGTSSAPPVEDPSTSSLFESLGNSKIANIAKEISKDIDVSALKAENPEDMIKGMLDFGSSNNVLGNIIQKVSNTLNSKISSGEIRHDELLGEAMSMMNLFGGSGGEGGGGGNPFLNNPLFAQMMKGMKSGKTAVRSDIVKKTDTRERLRKKLESRNKNVA